MRATGLRAASFKKLLRLHFVGSARHVAYLHCLTAQMAYPADLSTQGATTGTIPTPALTYVGSTINPLVLDGSNNVQYWFRRRALLRTRTAEADQQCAPCWSRTRDSKLLRRPEPDSSGMFVGDYIMMAVRAR